MKSLLIIILFITILSVTNQTPPEYTSRDFKYSGTYTDISIIGFQVSRDANCPICETKNEVTCGIAPSTTLDYRILSDDNHDFDAQSPWVVAIFESTEFAAGGSLISAVFVLTAAHKLTSESTYWAKAGQLKLSNSFAQYRKVTNIYKHSGFNRNTGANNIALLRVENPFTFNQYIAPICLPGPQDIIDIDNCYVSGWGKRSLSSSTNENKLRKVKLPVVPNDQCYRKLMATNRLPHNFQLHNTQMCAGGVLNEDACTGDGGSPLVCSITSETGAAQRFYQFGIVAWGIGCGQENVPGVYSNIKMLRSWIDNQLNEQLNISLLYRNSE